MSTLKGYVIKNDIKLFLLFNRELQHNILDRLMLFLTRCFDTPIVLAFVITTYLINLYTGHSFGKNLAILLIASEIITHLIKIGVNRARPFKTLSEALFEFIPPKDVYSFPSGHTCAAFSYALVIGMIFPQLKLLLLIIATFVGVSRVYLGYHYPTDVIIGAMIPLLMKFVLISLSIL